LQELTPRGQQAIADLAQRYGVSTDAVLTLLRALSSTNGTMAQFHHPELGGSGQWLQGGMTMVGDLFNNALKAKVNGLCVELAHLLSQQPFLPPSTTGNDGSRWWPAQFGAPAATGGQNQVRYAYFPGARRLAIESNGLLTFYDTLDHQIGGVAQQQGADDSLTFTSQHGPIRLADLPRVSADSFSQNEPGSAGNPTQKT
jgi:hypothetical protein